MSVDRRRFLQGGLAMAAAPFAQGATVNPASTVSGWPSAAVLPLWPGTPPGGGEHRSPDLPADWPPIFIRDVAAPALQVFRPTHPDGRAVLVCPGGAYLFVSIENEGVDVARTLNAMGVTVFVLVYRLPGEGWSNRADVPLMDAQRALRLIRHRASTWHIDADQVGVIGFSAGGHLAATLATANAEAVYTPVDAADTLSARPAHAALIYPVISMRADLTHGESRRQLLGDAPSAETLRRRSPEQNVTAQTPRTFIAHAGDDDVVPVEHALIMDRALRAAGVGSELHIFERGQHAFGIGRPKTPSALWPALYDAWSRG
jgi:acetyl esterase/lipase